MEETIKGYKVTLSTGKVVHLREMKIKHQELAAQAAAPRAGENTMLLGVAMAKEMIKLLVYAVNDAKVTQQQLEDLDSLFSMIEYGQLQRVMHQVMGDDSTVGKFQVELLTSGSS